MLNLPVHIVGHFVPNAGNAIMVVRHLMVMVEISHFIEDDRISHVLTIVYGFRDVQAVIYRSGLVITLLLVRKMVIVLIIKELFHQDDVVTWFLVSFSC